jgi:hypothetical protein
MQADGRLKLLGDFYHALSGLENPNGLNFVTQAGGLGFARVARLGLKTCTSCRPAVQQNVWARISPRGGGDRHSARTTPPGGHLHGEEGSECIISGPGTGRGDPREATQLVVPRQERHPLSNYAAPVEAYADGQNISPAEADSVRGRGAK